jgi:hypothetical protein
MPTNPLTPWPVQGDGSRYQAFFQTVLRIFGVDRAIAYTLIGRGWSAIAGPLTIVFIARFLRPAEQGYYYTFGSVIALNIFFELGLTYVLLQFASHEKAHLEWTTAGTLDGSEVAKMRLAAVLKLALRWYSVAAALVLILVLPAGLVFFSRNSAPTATIAWRIPWVWLATAQALDLLTAPLYAILEGSGKVSQLASMRVGQSIFANLGLWITLLCHGALFAGPIFETITFAFGLAWLALRHGRLFKSLLETDAARARFNWWTEVWPFQWRIALSWLSGYFIFQLLNPILFAFHGAVVAGQMGMSISLCNALLGVSMAWMSTKASPFGVLVAKRQWQHLNTLFFRTLRQSFLVLVAGSVVVYTCVFLLNFAHHPFSKRLLNPLPFGCLLAASLMNHLVFCEAYLLRAHKKEPFLLLSVVIACLAAVSIYVLARPFGALGASIAYLACSLTSLVWGTRIFLSKRKAFECQ